MRLTWHEVLKLACYQLFTFLLAARAGESPIRV
jgi:hypothetical protein